MATEMEIKHTINKSIFLKRLLVIIFLILGNSDTFLPVISLLHKGQKSASVFIFILHLNFWLW